MEYRMLINDETSLTAYKKRMRNATILALECTGKDPDTADLVWDITHAEYRISQGDAVVISSASEVISDSEEIPCLGELCEVADILLLNSIHAQITLKSLPFNTEEESKYAIVYAPQTFIHFLE